MHYTPEDIARLLSISLQHKLSDTEAAELEKWLSEGEHHLQIKQRLEDGDLLTQAFQEYSVIEERKSVTWDKIKENIGQTGKKKIRQYTFFKSKVWWAAACLIIVFSGIIPFLYFKYSEQEVGGYAAHRKKIAPARMGATVRLSDGREILLDTIANGTIALQGGITAKVIDGALIYPMTAKAEYNTISTSNGRHYQFVLSDGTRVWMNAASSIKFPTQFKGKHREVEMTGEVYFEVSKAKDKPFHVFTSNHLEVIVLGTHFNVNSYLNESTINTTLIEGSVLLKYAGQQRVIKPHETGTIGRGFPDGHQAGIAVTRDVDTDQVIAWKNGLFNFNGVGIEELMKQLERWYDIEVIFEGPIPKTKFFGEINRSESLDIVLASLERNNIQFKFTGERRLMVGIK